MAVPAPRNARGCHVDDATHRMSSRSPWGEPPGPSWLEGMHRLRRRRREPTAGHWRQRTPSAATPMPAREATAARAHFAAEMSNHSVCGRRCRAAAPWSAKLEDPPPCPRLESALREAVTAMESAPQNRDPATRAAEQTLRRRRCYCYCRHRSGGEARADRPRAKSSEATWWYRRHLR